MDLESYVHGMGRCPPGAAFEASAKFFNRALMSHIHRGTLDFMKHLIMFKVMFVNRLKAHKMNLSFSVLQSVMWSTLRLGSGS